MNAADTTATTVTVLTPADKVDILHNVSQMSIWGMGISFILGSLFTIFLLVVLDMVRALSQKPEE